MANEIIIFLVFIFTLSMFIGGMLFNKIWGLKTSQMKDFRDKTVNLQKRMKNAQVMGDIQQMRQLQLELNQLLKTMMTKQIVPLCSRCILFWVVFIIFSFVFIDYNQGLLPDPGIPLLGTGWVALYFLFSIGLVLVYYVGKKLYFKVTGKEVKRPSLLKEMLGDHSNADTDDFNETGLSDNWKERIQD